MKPRWILLVCAVAACAADSLAQDASAPTYQRRRQDGYADRGHWQPPLYRRGRPVAASQVGAGTFQRPYPYHLDYYKQRFGGSYEPYFGNLYGPPNVVLAPGFGYGGFGYGGLGYGGFGYGGSGAGLPAGGPLCPHCGQGWPTPLAAPVTPPRN